VAEPLPIAWALDRAPLCEHVRLAAVVTLVDASNFRASRDLSVSVGTQVAYADVLLVTKEAIAGEAETRQVVAAIHELAPKAMVRHGSTGDHARWLEDTLADPPLGTTIAAATPAERAHSHAHEHGDDCRDADTHAHGVDSTSQIVRARVDLEELEDQLGELPANYVRIKGIVQSGDGAWVAIHRVGLRVSTDPLPRKPDGLGAERGMIVALGSNLSSEKLAQCLAASYLGD
jgi:G3E family GTPase